MNILIFGCGSIGAHHAHAARSLKFTVFITDINPIQMEYMENKLYPSRYGKWDKKIIFLKYKDLFKTKKNFDLVIIGTSPISHIKVLKKVINKINYKKILVEKPLSVYNQNLSFLDNKNNNKNIYCGFNHSISPSILQLFELIKKKNIGKIKIVKINWKEDFKLVLKAHPWISSFKNAYFSNIKKGGGVLHEYSHAIHLGICLKNIILPNENIKISHSINLKKIGNSSYDNKCTIKFKNKDQIIEINIDALANPPKKNLIIYGEKGKIKWDRDMKNLEEKITFLSKKKCFIKKFKVTRPSDFINQLKILLKNKKNLHSRITSINSAIEVMKIIKDVLKLKYV
ncbi:Gfo/Idh/MocA family oxidoreductase [Candidatus Pelagibacter sp.]|jgi:predicted dehydrogenase|nr:Gfo/Idh/MocA family oxidoreductase [Candidatus Pelagibacter sp.]